MIFLNITIPFSKDILFKTKIAEICSISLEQDVSINEKEILGDFIVSGDYKSLDVNVDTNPFNYVVPFSIALDKDIDLNTLKYEISNFSYNIVGEDILNVVISFHVDAEKNRSYEDVFEKVDLVEEKKEVKESENLDDNIIIDSDLDDERNDDVSVDILTSSELEKDYITYHIHLVKVNETLESISSYYQIDKDVIMELNDVTSINIGDKLLIPVNTNEK